MKNKYALLVIFLFVACLQKSRTTITPLRPITNININDSYLDPDKNFKKGDVRRYGLYPGTKNIKSINDILELGEKGMPIFFPKGYYPVNIILKGKYNLSLNFDDVTIGGSLYIIDDSKRESSKILFEGKLTVLDKVFIRKSNNISIDSLAVESDTLRNIYGHKNRGVSIYSGAKTIKFDYLNIDGTGGKKDEHYKYTASSLQIHGWKNNPENVLIKKLSVTNSARSAIYITGGKHRILNADITNFGLGSKENISGLEDARPKEEKDFSGIWVNRCNDCIFDTLAIKNPLNKGDYSLRLDEGKYENPTFIQNITLRENAQKLPILSNKLTNVLVRNEY